MQRLRSIASLLCDHLRDRRADKRKRQTQLNASGNQSELLNLKMLRSLNDLAGLDAFSAHLHPAVSTTRQLNANGLQIRVKTASGLVVSV